jgi:hypothetical protein
LTDVEAGAAGREWIDALPEELVGQKRILSALLAYCSQDPDARWLGVSCSLGRGAADRLSDVDAGIGAAAGQVGAVTAAVAGSVPLGDRIDTLVMDWRSPTTGPGPGAERTQRIFVQCADGAQLDLVVIAAKLRPGHAPDEVVLLDRDGQLTEQFTPSVDIVGGEEVRQWAFLGWIALADVTKYLARGSLWEALMQLAAARDRVWALWAAAKGARYPVFGLTQVLDRDPDDLPPGIESTVPDGKDAEALREAARVTAELLAEVSALAAARYPTELPKEMAQFIGARLGARVAP